MALLTASFLRRVFCLLAIVLAVLGFSSFAAKADISSSLREALQEAFGTDLRVDSFVLDRSQATVGDTLRATVGVSNQGKGAAPSTILTFWAAFGSPTSTANAYRLATVRLGTLQSRAVVTSASTFPVPNLGRVGTYQILASVESSKAEANKQNNTQAKALQVASPAFSTPTPLPCPTLMLAPPRRRPPPLSLVVAPPHHPLPRLRSSQAPPHLPPSLTSSTISPTPPVAPSPPPPTAACDYYASPTGRGDGNSPDSPFRIQTFWRLAAPGKTLCLLDGTYTGADSMIAPSTQGAPAGLSGSATGADIKNGICPNCITIRALNDGAVLIDGQFVRIPVRLASNSWFVVEGSMPSMGPVSFC